MDGGADPARRWPEDDVKEFIKGLRHHGKNFFKIGKEFLPHREIPELVEFYYLWKKTPGAANNRPRGRKPRPSVTGGKRVKTSGKNGKGHRNEDDPDDLSSCSEEPDETGNGNGEEKDDLSPYYCRHCYTTSSRDWHHAGKEKLLVCLDCRIYFKKYGELPCLEPNNLAFEEETTSEEEEEAIIEAVEDIKPPTDTDKKIDINAIEQDSSAEDAVDGAASYENVEVNGTSDEPLEIKAELPKSSIGLLSPVPTMGTTQLNPGLQVPQPPTPLHPGMHHPLSQVPGSNPVVPPANLLPGPPPAHSNNEIQVLPKPQAQPPPHVPQQQPPHQLTSGQNQQQLMPQQQLQQQQKQQQQQQQQLQQQLHQQQQQQHQQQQQQPPQPKPPTPQPPPPREDSPPPKPDGSECHRSQSAIFTRQWNRGEGNSCSRTDLYFKPVPDSKLDRKRQERLRKAANERDDAMKAAQAQAQEQAAKVARIEMTNHLDHLARHTPQPPPGLSLPPGLGSPYGHLSEMERFERERAMNAALSAAAGSPRSPYPPGSQGPPGSQAAAAAAAAAAFGRHLPGMDNQRDLEILRANMAGMAGREALERQYAERMSAQAAALATDPLVRLQLAGVNPEIPGSGLHPAYAQLMAGGGMGGGPRPPPGFDPRFRSPAEMMLRPPPGFSPRPNFAPADLYQRQLMERSLMDRDHALRTAAAHQQASQLMAQQEEFLRLEQAARNPQVSRQ